MEQEMREKRPPVYVSENWTDDERKRVSLEIKAEIKRLKDEETKLRETIQYEAPVFKENFAARLSNGELAHMIDRFEDQSPEAAAEFFKANRTAFAEFITDSKLPEEKKDEKEKRAEERELEYLAHKGEEVIEEDWAKALPKNSKQLFKLRKETEVDMDKAYARSSPAGKKEGRMFQDRIYAINRKLNELGVPEKE